MAMEPTDLIVFAAALFVASAALVARVLVRGTAGAFAFMFGIALGDVLWLSAAVLGLAFIAKTFAMFFLALKYLGAAYLLYLAWKLWTAPALAPEATPLKAERPLRLFAAGLSIMLGNPKVMVFYLALLPNIIDLGGISALGFLELVLVTYCVVTAVDGTYVLMAARARRLLTSPRAVRLVNRGSATVMAGAAAAIASR